MTRSDYRGRFAPSPTGPLHFGSLVTALASYLDARSRQGTWLVRLEDLDPLREPQDAAPRIFASLEAHGLLADESVRYQSQRHGAYHDAIRQLLQTARAYPCPCSRRELADNHGRHPRQCRDKAAERGPALAADWPPDDIARHGIAIRFALHDEQAHWHDQLLGPQRQTVRAELDDPVILRKEGFFAYQLAVVVDDLEQRINHVVRGSDLLETTAQQRQLIEALGGAAPDWLHIPVIINEQGQKLSKQTHAPALADDSAGSNLHRALQALGQAPPAGMETADPAELLLWGAEHWQPGLIPRSPHSA